MFFVLALFFFLCGNGKVSVVDVNRNILLVVAGHFDFQNVFVVVFFDVGTHHIPVVHRAEEVIECGVERIAEVVKSFFKFVPSCKIVFHNMHFLIF